jgi:hypothetical protein
LGFEVGSAFFGLGVGSVFFSFPLNTPLKNPLTPLFFFFSFFVLVGVGIGIGFFLAVLGVGVGLALVIFVGSSVVEAFAVGAGFDLADNAETTGRLEEL